MKILVKFPNKYRNDFVIMDAKDLGAFAKKHKLWNGDIHHCLSGNRVHHKNFQFEKLSPDREAKISTAMFLKWRKKQTGLTSKQI